MFIQWFYYSSLLVGLLGQVMPHPILTSYLLVKASVAMHKQPGSAESSCCWWLYGLVTDKNRRSISVHMLEKGETVWVPTVPQRSMTLGLSLASLLCGNKKEKGKAQIRQANKPLPLLLSIYQTSLMLFALFNWHLQGCLSTLSHSR